MKTLNVFWKDLLILTKDRGTYINLLVLPIMFSVVLTLALGGVFGGGKSSSPVSVPLVAPSAASEPLAKTIESIPGITWQRQSLTDAREQVETSKALGAVVLSDDGSSLDFFEDPTQLSNAKLLFGQISAYIAAHSLGEQNSALQQGIAVSGPSTLQDQAAAASAAGKVSITESQAGSDEAAIEPSASEQYIPGFTVAFLFFIASTIAQYMFMERERGTLRRLLTSPVRRYSVLLGKLLPNILIGFVQVVVIFAVGKLFFGMNLGNPLALFLVTCAAVAAANGFGLMITALSKTQAQATGMATLLVFTLATVAGCYVPLSLMPGFMQNIALATPQGWAMSAYQNIIIKGADVAAVSENILVLVGFAAAFFVVGLSRFRFEER